jgi:hypothetical protein
MDECRHHVSRFFASANQAETAYTSLVRQGLQLMVALPVQRPVLWRTGNAPAHIASASSRPLVNPRSSAIDSVE